MKQLTNLQNRYKKRSKEVDRQLLLLQSWKEGTCEKGSDK